MKPAAPVPDDGATAAAVTGSARPFDRHDVDAVMAAMTADCVFESTAPSDGEPLEGRSAVRAAWTEFFGESADAVFETEEQIVTEDPRHRALALRVGGRARARDRRVSDP